MLETEIIMVVVGFLGAIIAAWIGARAAIRAGKYQARAIIEAARISRGPRSGGKDTTGLELLLAVLLVLSLAMVVALVTVTVGAVDVELLLRSAEKAILPLLF